MLILMPGYLWEKRGAAFGMGDPSYLELQDDN